MCYNVICLFRGASVVLIPKGTGWQASLKGTYKGFPFTFLAWADKPRVAKSEVHASLAKFIQFVEEF